MLNAEHEVSSFHCGDQGDEPDIAEYLQTTALIDMSKGLAKTFVIIDTNAPTLDNPVVGFFTVRTHAQKIHERFFEEYEDYNEDTALEKMEVPLIELMYLARSSSYEGQRLGDVLMVSVIEKLAYVAEAVGFIGIHLRSTEKGKFLYERYDFKPFTAHRTYDGSRYILPLSDILAIDNEIKQRNLSSQE